MRLPIILTLALLLPRPAQADDCGAAGQPANGAVADLNGALAQVPSKDGGGWRANLLQGLSDFGNRVSEQVQEVRQRFAPNEEERRALAFVHLMLAPDKLGGDDRTFNQNDLDRVIEALLRDPAVRQQIRAGILGEAARRANDAPVLLQGMAHRIARRRTTPGTRAYQRHYPGYWAEGVAEARSRIREEINSSLEAEWISPAEGQGPSGVQRTLTLDELERFQAGVEIMQSYAERVGGGGSGPSLTLPRGLSQEDVQALLDGRIPPNAVMGGGGS